MAKTTTVLALSFESPAVALFSTPVANSYFVGELYQQQATIFEHRIKGKLSTLRHMASMIHIPIDISATYQVL